MLKIRLKYCGKKNQPIYQIVVMQSSSSRDSRCIKYLGFYNPVTKEIKLDIPKIIENLQYGVQLTKTIKNLFIKIQIINKYLDAPI